MSARGATHSLGRDLFAAFRTGNECQDMSPYKAALAYVDAVDIDSAWPDFFVRAIFIRHITAIASCHDDCLAHQCLFVDIDAVDVNFIARTLRRLGIGRIRTSFLHATSRVVGHLNVVSATARVLNDCSCGGHNSWS